MVFCGGTNDGAGPAQHEFHYYFMEAANRAACLSVLFLPAKTTYFCHAYFSYLADFIILCVLGGGLILGADVQFSISIFGLDLCAT